MQILTSFYCQPCRTFVDAIALKQKRIAVINTTIRLLFAKVQNTAVKLKKTKRKHLTDMTAAWYSVNPDKENMVHIFGGTFRVR